MTRLIEAWRNLEPEGRPAVLAALGLFVAMFLPWYSKTDTVVVEGTAKAGHAAAVASQTSLNAFQAFSFVEAAVLLISGGVLFLLFRRAEGADFRMPGGDGTVVMAAGAWAAVLIFYRLLDKPGLQGTQRVTATVGVEWGIFVALLLALGLAYAGGRMRAAARPEPPLRASHRRHSRHAAEPDGPAGPPAQRSAPGEDVTEVTEPLRGTPAAAAPGAPVRARSLGRDRYPPAPPARPNSSGEQLSFEDPPTRAE